MTSAMGLVDILNDALYLTPATYYSNGTQINPTGADEPTRGDINGNQWYVSYAPFAASYVITASRMTEIDLTGLDHQVIAPMGMQSYQAEPTGTYSKAGIGSYVRDFTWVSTCPMDLDELHDAAGSFSPRAPYQRFASGGGTDIPSIIAKEQLFTGKAMLWVNDTSIDSLLGFMRNVWNQDYTIGNFASTRKLYYYRVIYAFGNFAGEAHSVPFMLDLPARHDQIAYVPVDADESTEAMTMIRSYQAPGGGQ